MNTNLSSFDRLISDDCRFEGSESTAAVVLQLHQLLGLQLHKLLGLHTSWCAGLHYVLSNPWQARTPQRLSNLAKPHSFFKQKMGRACLGRLYDERIE